jgi:hypothetical protein
MSKLDGPIQFTRIPIGMLPPEAETRRRVQYSGHCEYWEAWFHGWTVVNGERMAVIEHDNGQLKFERGLHCLRFLEPGE